MQRPKLSVAVSSTPFAETALSLHPLDLYEIAVTSPDRLARFLLALHGRKPRTLGEDFSGSAALSRAWLRLSPRHRAVATDLDRPTLDHIPKIKGLKKINKDVLAVTDKADIIAATNFPIGYWHTRKDLLRYLRHARSRLNKHGVLVADLYGGPGALISSKRTQRIALAQNHTLHYTWHQRSIDPLTNRVKNSIHFRITAPGKPPLVIKDAFTYDWRLWSIPELREALHEAGFRHSEAHDRLGGAIDHLGHVHTRPVAEGELEEDYVVYVVGRV